MADVDSVPWASSLHVLAGTCQLVVGDTLYGPPWPDFCGIAQRFANIPNPASYAEAMMAVGILVQFTRRLGQRLHHHVHTDEQAAGCSFDPLISSLNLRLPSAHPSAWDAGCVIREWLAAYEAAFTRAHRKDVTPRARQRLQSPSNRITVAALARELGCSVSVLQRRFLDDTGETLTAFRQRVRTRAAIDLLRSSNSKVDMVARDVGWTSKKDLYKALAKLANMSPLEIRRLSVSEASAVTEQISRSPGSRVDGNRACPADGRTDDSAEG